jgi:large subunit ribosomal protein L3
MGAKRITAQRLKVIESRPDENLLFVRGAIPGAVNGLIMVRKSKKG